MRCVKPKVVSPKVVSIDSGGHRERVNGARDDLVLAHLGLVRPIAERVATTLPPSFSIDDLVGAGNIGLLQAATRYRPEAHGDTPFSAYARPRIHGAIVDSVRRRQYADATHDPLDAAPEPSSQRDMETYIDCGRRSMQVWEAVDTLDAPHRDVMVEHYCHEHPLPQVCVLLGMPKGRATQLHAEAVETLRKLLA